MLAHEQQDRFDDAVRKLYAEVTAVRPAISEAGVREGCRNLLNGFADKFPGGTPIDPRARWLFALYGLREFFPDADDVTYAMHAGLLLGSPRVIGTVPTESTLRGEEKLLRLIAETRDSWPMEEDLRRIEITLGDRLPPRKVDEEATSRPDWIGNLMYALNDLYLDVMGLLIEVPSASIIASQWEEHWDVGRVAIAFVPRFFSFMDDRDRACTYRLYKAIYAMVAVAMDDGEHSETRRSYLQQELHRYLRARNVQHLWPAVASESVQYLEGQGPPSATDAIIHPDGTPVPPAFDEKMVVETTLEGLAWAIRADNDRECGKRALRDYANLLLSIGKVWCKLRRGTRKKQFYFRHQHDYLRVNRDAPMYETPTVANLI